MLNLLFRRVASILLVVSAGCAGAPPVSPSSAPAADPTIAANVARLPADAPVLFMLRIDRLVAVAPRLDAIASSLGVSGLTGAFAAARAEGVPLVVDPATAGFDPGRPIVGSLLSVPDGSALDSATLGNLPDPAEAPDFVHGRLFIPALDPVRLIASLTATSEGVARVESFAVAGDVTLQSPWGIAVFVPERDSVRVELALGRPQDFDRVKDLVASGSVDAAPVQRVATPALQSFLRGAGTASLYGVLGMWAKSLTALKLMWAKRTLAHAPPSAESMLRMASLTTVLAAAETMDPHQSAIYDVSASLAGAPDGLDLTLTRSLRPAAAAAAAVASKEAGPVFDALQERPLAELRIGPSLRTMTTASDREVALSHMMEAIEAGGPAAILHQLLEPPWPLLAQVVADRPLISALAGSVPTSLTLIIDRFALSAETGDLEVVAALALTYPAGTDLTPHRKLIEDLRQRLADRGQAAQVFLDIRGGEDSTLVVIGLGRDPSLVIDLDSPRRSTSVEIAYRPQTGQVESPQTAALLKALGSVQVRDQTEGYAQVTRIHLGAGSVQASSPWHFVGEEPPVLRPLGVGERCLIDGRRQLRPFYRGLAAVAPPERAGAVNSMATVLERSWRCAEADPSTAKTAGLARTSFVLFAAHLAVIDGATDRATAVAQAVCDGGRPAGCALLEQLTAGSGDVEPGRAPAPPPVASLTLQKPRIRGPLDAQAIREVINANRAPLKACYQQELDRGKAFDGLMEVGFRIDRRGHTKARIKLRDPRPEWERCVRDVIEAMVFPRPARGTVEVSYPMLFTPRQ